MTSRIFVFLLLAGVLCLPCAARAQQPRDQSPPDSRHQAAESFPSNHEAMMHRGQEGMGFSQTKTTHHFLLKPYGGVISVSANDPKDVATRDQIRMHLSHIARAFSEGDFDIPMFVHDQTPPGVAVLKSRSKDIQYRFKETDAGGEVTLSSHSAPAVTAIHDFLKFQIREHKTGDPLALP